MRLLLDTHALIWWWANDPHLPARMREEMADQTNEIYASAASGWEIATKVRSGRLPEMTKRITQFDQGVTEDGFRHLHVRHDHGVRAGLMSGEHRDPFDRVLAAQALIEGLTVVSRDPAFAAFGCDVIW